MRKRVLQVCGMILVMTAAIYQRRQIFLFLGQSAAWAAGVGPVAAEHAQGYDETFPPAGAAQTTEVKAVDLAMTSGKFATVDGIALKNGTSRKADVDKMLREPFEKPSFAKTGPAVLIYHTHAQEKYAEGTSGVIEIGEKMKEIFEQNGLKTIHITTDYTKSGSFRTSYQRSLKGVEEVLQKYPSIRIVLDVHRDSITDGGQNCAPVTAISNRDFAQVMMICGTDEKGLSHPSWRKNLRFALALSQTAQRMYPGLLRPVNLNANRYNTHVTPYALLLEIGSDASRTADAERAACAVTDVIVKTVK